MKALFLNAAIALAAITGCTKANAQSYDNPIPVTVEVTPVQYDGMMADPMSGGVGMRNLLRLGDTHFRMTEKIYREVPIGSNPSVPQPCIEQMTPARFAYNQARANQYCRLVKDCAQNSNCAWVMYFFWPTNGCGSSWDPYAYQMPASTY